MLQLIQIMGPLAILAAFTLAQFGLLVADVPSAVRTRAEVTPTR